MNYLTKTIPKSIKEVLDYGSHEKVITLVKNAMADYIKKFTTTLGVNRDLASEVGSTALNFITDIDVKDPTKKKTTIEILSEQLIEKVPAFVIADTGFEWIPSGLGQKDSSFYENNDIVYEFAFIYKIPLTVAIVTHDEASTKDLTMLTLMMCGPLQNIAGGNRIESDDKKSSWVITFPPILPAGTFEKIDTPNDPITKKWAGILNIDVTYEAKVFIKTVQDLGHLEGSIVDSNFSLDPVIKAPNSLKLNGLYDIVVEYMEPNDSLFLDKFNPQFCLTWERLSECKLRVRGTQLGSFTILVLSMSGQIRSQKTIQIVL